MDRIGIAGIIGFMIILVSCDDGSSCTKNVNQSELDEVNAAQLEIDNAIIQDYITSNNLGPIQEINGIKYILTTEGNGVTPCLENSVTVIYTGRLLSNGTIFDKNLSGIDFPLNNLILGWKLSFPSFTKGTVATIFVPSGYGYGTKGNGPIPANANIMFNIELVNVR